MYNGASNQFNPYVQAGQGAQNNLMQGGNMFANPEQAYNHFAQNYQMSAGAQNQLHTGLNAISNSMAAQGLAGSGNHMKALSGFTQGLINQDMGQQWNNMLGAGYLGAQYNGQLYRGGLQGSEDQAGLAEAEAQQQAQSQQNWQNGLFGAAGQIGGDIMGGPIGSKIEKTIAGWL